MNFKLWLESIKVPHYMPNLFFEEIEKKAEGLENIFVDQENFFSEIDDLADEIYFESPFDVYKKLPFKFRECLNSDRYENRCLLSKTIKEYHRLYDLENIQRKWVEESFYDIDLINRLKINFKDFIEAHTDYYRRKETYQDKDGDYRRVGHYQDSLDSSETEEHLEKIKKAKKILDAIFDYIKLLKKVHTHIEAKKERIEIHADQYGGWKELKKTRPFSKDVMVLYHTTPFVREILKDGFKTQNELQKQALGGSTDNAICFTADPNIAKAIKTALIEVINIANGKMGMNDVMKLVKEEGIDIRKFSDFIVDMKLRQLKANKDDIRKRVFDLYRIYLNQTKLRYDPLFFGVGYENFEGLDVSNVGVLACQCDITKTKRYLISMEEYRIPKDAILKINKTNI